MTARIVFPRRAGEAGLWLSKPGVDVLTATADADFLIRPSLKNEQIINGGHFSILAAGGQYTVYWPYTLPQIPVVMFWQCYYADRVNHPWRAAYLTNMQCYPTTSGALFVNGGETSMLVRYLAVARTAAF